MKKVINILLAMSMFLASISPAFVFSLEPQGETQKIVCNIFPNNLGTYETDINKFLANVASDPASDERKYIVAPYSTAICMDWNGTGLTRFSDSSNGVVVYKFDLADTASDFSITLKQQSWNYTIYASKDNTTWLPIGIDTSVSMPGAIANTSFPNNNATIANMASVLANNPTKILYIKLEVHMGGGLYYQGLWIESKFTKTPDIAKTTLALKVYSSSLSAPDLSTFKMELKDSNLISEQPYLNTYDPAFDFNWNGMGIFRFLGGGKTVVYKFDLDNKAVDFNISAWGQAGSYIVEVSKNGVDGWLTLLDSSDDFTTQSLKSNNLTPESSKANVTKVLKSNTEKIVYLKITGKGTNAYVPNFAYSSIIIDYSYYLSQEYYTLDSNFNFDPNKVQGFDTNTDAENGYILNNNGTDSFYWPAISHNVRRVPDGKSIVYKFELESTTDSARFLAKVKFDFKFSVSSDAEYWSLITAGSVDGGSSGNTLDFDITPALTNNPSKTIYIKCEASQDGVENAGGYAATGLFLLTMDINYVISKPEVKLTEKQNIRLNVYPNTGKPSDIDRFNSTIGAVDERPYLYDAGSSYCADWNNTGVVRFIAVGESVTYKYDLNDRAIDFTLSAYNQGYGYKVETSKDLINWYQIGEDLPSSLSVPANPQMTVLTSQNDNISKENIKKVLTYNPEKIIYVKISAKNPGLFTYWYTTLTQIYNISSEAIDLPTIPTGPVDEYAGIHSFVVGSEEEKTYTFENDATFIASDGYRYTKFDGYIIYKFEFPQDATVAVLKARLKGEFLLQASTDNKTWYDIGRAPIKTVYSTKTEADYEFRLSRFLNNNEQKVIYIRCTDPTLEDGFGFMLKNMTILWKLGILPTESELKPYNFEAEKPKYADNEEVYNTYFFGAGTTYEVPFLQYDYESTLGDFFGSNIRYMHYDSFSVFKYSFPSNTIRAEFLINVLNNQNISVSTDCQNWEVISKQLVFTHNMSHWETLIIDMTPYLKDSLDRIIYIKLKNDGGEKSGFGVPYMEMDYWTLGPSKNDASTEKPIAPDYGETPSVDGEEPGDSIIDDVKVYDDIWYGAEVETTDDPATEQDEKSTIISVDIINEYLASLSSDKNVVSIILDDKAGKITSDALLALKKAGKGLKIIIKNNANETIKIFEIEIIVNTEEFDITNTESSTIEKSVYSKFDKNKTVIISFTRAGILPGKMKVTLANNKNFKKGIRKTLYYFDRETSKLKLLKDNIAITSDEKYIQFEIEKSTDYVITTDVKNAVKNDVKDNVISNVDTETGKTHPEKSPWLIVLIIVGSIIVLAGAALLTILKIKNKQSKIEE